VRSIKEMIERVVKNIIRTLVADGLKYMNMVWRLQLRPSK